MYGPDPDYLRDQAFATQERQVGDLCRDVDADSRRRVEDALLMFPNDLWRQSLHMREALKDMLVALDRVAYFEGHEAGYRTGKRFMAAALHSSLSAKTTKDRISALKQAAEAK